MNTPNKNKVEKHILYICSPFFGYYKHIIKELELQGYTVDYYNDRPSENGFIKGMVKINRKLMDPLIKRYFENIINETRNKKYDMVFIMNSKVFTEKMIKRLRKSHQSARFIFYMWDALSLYPHAKELLSVFDKAYSFDLKDCENLDKLEFLPLFYTKPYEEIGKSIINDKYSEREYDIISVCTVHPNRYLILNKIFPYLRQKGLNIYSYMFIERLQYLYNKVFVKEFKKAKSKEFQYKSLSEDAMIRTLRNSKAVFDIQHHKQSGLTMRAIETLGAKRKLITYNKNIVYYDFYNEENVLVLSENNWDCILDFIKKEYVSIDDEIYKKYSLESWTKKLIEG